MASGYVFYFSVSHHTGLCPPGGSEPSANSLTSLFADSSTPVRTSSRLHGATSFTSRWRVSYPEKKSPSGFTFSILNAGAALATRAKHLRVPESTRLFISRLRKFTGAATRTLPRAASMPAQHAFELDDFDDFGDQSEAEDDNSSETDSKRSQLYPSRSWTQGCT
ncbi:hypothetical protein PHYPSEUDO_014608 [Phytophthora pseudosyringae]|uniref:Uncharacterized protein n=1 Tax=Phytophthora pseudosyringae TaxID=221518 RepID=A0A8T1W1V0_9STRA|nr:hypothetical protein PHYPSEUDO_014608 [Phytophthora pseudosyringae]